MINWEKTALEYRSDPRSSTELLAIVKAHDMDAEDEDYWKPVRILQHRLSSEIEVIEALSRSSDTKDQDDAATILGQNSVKDKIEAERCQAVLAKMLSRSNLGSPPLRSILFALGHLMAPGYAQLILPFHRHPDAEVRYAVASSLGGCTEEAAIDALIELSRDSDFDVRNWATFGLGQLIDTDTENIRQALVDRLGEPDSEIRGEALVGLVNRNDTRAIEPLCREINDWQLQPLIHYCAEKLIEDRERFSEEWRLVYEQLEQAGFKSKR